MMSTPAATSVESVGENRAIVIFNTVSPMRIGSFSLRVSHFFRPLSVFFQRKKAQMLNGINRMRYGLVRRRFDTLTAYAVSVGSWPFNDAKIFTNTGTRNMSIPISTSVAKMSTIVG